MNKKLTRHGDSLALVLENDLLALLQIDEDTPLEVSTDGRQLVVSPQCKEPSGERFGTAYGGPDEHRAKSFRRLAG